MAGELEERLRASEALNNRYAWERDKAREERDAAERRSEAHWKPRLEAAADQISRLTQLVQVLIDNDPDEPIADSGETVIDLWRHNARAELARRALSEPDKEGT